MRPPNPALNSRRRISDFLKLLCGAAYRGQGRMGTGCISPGGNLLRFFCIAGGRLWPRLCEFEACGHAQSKETQKFILRSLSRPNQIPFSHSLGPLPTSVCTAACPQLAEADLQAAYFGGGSAATS
jgi:hypothetical protein